MDDFVVVATGHRPPRLGLDYSKESNQLLTEFAEQVLLEAVRGRDNRFVEVVSGVAQGWDQAVAHAAILHGFSLVCAVPFDGQERKWPKDAQKRYRAILEYADEVRVVSPGDFSPWKFWLRDKFMVDRCAPGDVLLALFDKEPNGGTWHTVKYATEQGLRVDNVWDRWLAFRG